MDNGSIVHIDYDLYNASNDKLIETTREEVAKEHDLHDENREYSPMITTVVQKRPGILMPAIAREVIRQTAAKTHAQ